MDARSASGSSRRSTTAPWMSMTMSAERAMASLWLTATAARHHGYRPTPTDPECRQKSGVDLYTLTLVTVPNFPGWIVPMAPHEEQTDVSCGIAVPLHVKVSP